jgi:sigma-B regulation protein RsbQ
MDIYKRNNVTVLGKGTTPMIFAHGFGCAQQMWRDVWPAFENDYRIILFDYVGSGNSDIDAYNDERYASLNGYAEDILDICRELNLKNSILVGHSVSSMTGIIASIKEPDFFQRLILITPSPRYINDSTYHGGFEMDDIDELFMTMWQNYEGWARHLAPAVMKNEERPDLSEELTESFCSTNVKIAQQFAEVTFLSDNRKDLKKVTHPTLILQCTDDIIAPMNVGEYLKENLKNSTYNVMKATGHCPHMSAPEETITLIKNYLSSLTLSDN